MTTWVLILYLSTGAMDFATGGPTVIDGFTSREKCEWAKTQAASNIPKYDWGYCMWVIK